MKQVTFLLMGLFPLQLHAQQVVVYPGDLQGYEKVRLHIPEGSQKNIVGKVTAFDGEHLVVLRNGWFSQLVRPAQIEAVEVMDGKRRWGAAAIGIPVGAAVGGLAVLVYADAKYKDDTYNSLVAGVVGVPIGGLVGAIVGAAIGRPRWVSVQFVPTSRQKPGFRTRIGLVFSIRKR